MLRDYVRDIIDARAKSPYDEKRRKQLAPVAVKRGKGSAAKDAGLPDLTKPRGVPGTPRRSGLKATGAEVP